jgi:hypothetical protein
MFTRFKHALQVNEIPVTLNKVTVNLWRYFTSIQKSRPIKRTYHTIARHPPQSIGVDLVAWDITAPHLFHYPIPLKRQE